MVTDNIVFIMVDDMRWDMVEAIHSVQRMAHSPVGMSFTQGFNANPVCCASRATTLTGLYSKNNGIYGNLPPIGGFHLFDDHTTIATALHAAGYSTGLIGKYLNEYNDEDATYVAPGWDRWWAIASRGGAYYGYGVSDDGKLKTYGFEPNEYLTDVVSRQAERFISTAPEPFFAYIAPTAPHKNAVPADRHLRSFNQLGPWNPDSLNEANVSDKPQWVQALPLLNEGKLANQKKFRRNMYQTLLAVDDLIENVLTALRNRGVLERTMVVFMSDNGYLWGEHRLIGKSVPYLEATRMPLTFRWPKINPLPNRNALVQNIDLAPTFADVADIPFDCDGRSLVSALKGDDPGPETVYIEHGRLHAEETPPEHEDEPQGFVPAFAQVQSKRWTYTWLSTEEEELYDLSRDPLQLKNVADKGIAIQADFQAACRQYLDKYPPGMTSAP